MLLFDPIFLQAAPGGTDWSFYIFPAAMLLVFWLFIIRPQSKKQREQKNFLGSLEKGDQVVTTSGILGKITKIEEEIITIEVGTKVYLRVTKSAISKELTDAVYATA